MVRWLVVLVVACGRVDFADRIDSIAAKPCVTPVGHDEDGDSVDDACDGCPHLADPEQIDSDGDGVDDVCDPNPATPGDAIAFFDPFTAIRPEWTFTANLFTQSGDDLDVDATVTYFHASLPMPLGRVHYAYSATLVTVAPPAGASTDQILVGLEQDGGNAYYCELFKSTVGMPAFGYTVEASGSYARTDTDDISPLAPGDVTTSFDDRGGEVSCTTTWPGDRPTIGGADPVGYVPTKVSIGIGSIQLALHWFVAISSP